MKNHRGVTLRLTAAADLVTETCYSCGVLFAMTAAYQQGRRNDRAAFYCPNGHAQVYTGPSESVKRREAEVREQAARDQAEAAIRDAEAARVELARIRGRIANGVCPSCNRSFENVRRHIADQHPTFAHPVTADGPEFLCSCGDRFTTFRGLRIHQGRSRDEAEWARPGTSRFLAHLTRGVEVS